MIEYSGNSDAVIGYYIMDEPSALDFPALAKAVAAVKKYAPGKLGYINLYPNYASLWTSDRNKSKSQLGTKSYTEYLEQYIQKVNPKIISYDNYSVQYSKDLQDKEESIKYFTNLLEIRRVAMKYNLPFWNIVGSTQIKRGDPIPSLANMRLKAYTSLAAGCNGISWFTYLTGGFYYGPIDNNGDKTLTWFYLKEVNRQILNLGPIINKLNSTGVYFTAPVLDDSLNELPGEIIESVKCEGPLMIGEFTDDLGFKYAMVVNLSLEKSLNFILPLSTKMQQEKIWLITASGEESLKPKKEKMDIDNHKKNGLWLRAGEGVLIKLGD